MKYLKSVLLALLVSGIVLAPGFINSEEPPEQTEVMEKINQHFSKHHPNVELISTHVHIDWIEAEYQQTFKGHSYEAYDAFSPYGEFQYSYQLIPFNKLPDIVRRDARDSRYQYWNRVNSARLKANGETIYLIQYEKDGNKADLWMEADGEQINTNKGKWLVRRYL